MTISKEQSAGQFLWGHKSLDEFVAEAFGNPEGFQNKENWQT